MSVEFDKNEAMEEGKKLICVGWSYQLLLACEAIGPVKSFVSNKDGTWSVEYFEPHERIDYATKGMIT